jgi:hypothetical protein
VTLILVPPGRGNWSQTMVQITGRRAAPLFFKVGAMFELGGRMFRIAKVLP